MDAKKDSNHISTIRTLNFTDIEPHLERYLKECTALGGNWEMEELHILLDNLSMYGLSDYSANRISKLLAPKTTEDVIKKVNDLIGLMNKVNNISNPKYFAKENKVFVNTEDPTAKVPVKADDIEKIIATQCRMANAKRDIDMGFTAAFQELSSETPKLTDLRHEDPFHPLARMKQTVDMKKCYNILQSIVTKKRKKDGTSNLDKVILMSALDEVQQIVDDIDPAEIGKMRAFLMKLKDSRSVGGELPTKPDTLSHGSINFLQLTDDYLNSFDIDTMITELLREK
uniref:Phosphoprotein n=1 Tax=Rhabditophanes sp. KR3021 TaxID=114890 RepID=A0AC35TMS1_9BILA